MAEPLVEVSDLSVQFDVGRKGFWGSERQYLSAVDHISFAIAPGEVLGLAGLATLVISAILLRRRRSVASALDGAV